MIYLSDTFIPANSAEIQSSFTEIKEGDTNTVFQIKLLDSSGQPVDLTGATVTLYFSNQSNNLLLLNKQGTLSGTPTDGTVSFQFSEDDSTGNGTINIQVNVTYSDGDIEKFPANGYKQISITPSLDNLENVQLSTYTLKQITDQLTTSFTSTIENVHDQLQTEQTNYETTVNNQMSTYQNGINETVNNLNKIYVSSSTPSDTSATLWVDTMVE